MHNLIANLASNSITTFSIMHAHACHTMTILK